MNIEQCWMRYLKAEQLMEQGHWPEAHRLYEDVLNHLPSHIHKALENDLTNLANLCVWSADYAMRAWRNRRSSTNWDYSATHFQPSTKLMRCSNFCNLKAMS